MNCPNCQAPAFEGIESCRECGFDRRMADSMFGVPPHISPKIYDPYKALTTSDIERITRRTTEFTRAWPQFYLGTVLTRLPAKAPLRAYMFWLAERAQAIPNHNSGGDARNFLILIDLENARLGLLPGYAIENLIPPRRLDQVLETGLPHLAQGKLCRGILTMIDDLDQLLEESWRNLGPVFGIPRHELDELNEDANRTTSREHVALAEKDGWGMM